MLLSFHLLIISIHAPARGATYFYHPDNLQTVISIHAPARGATFLLVLLPTFHIFQSTLPRGERHCLKDSVIMTQNFNPRSREGSDTASFSSSDSSTYFNPRSREGSDSKIAHIRNIFSGNYVNLVKICK